MIKISGWIKLFLLVLMLSACARPSTLHEGITSFGERNYRQAFLLLLPEAVRGQADAQYAVGYMYYYGRGVVEDREKAWHWINCAAKAGQPDAKQALVILDYQHKVAR